MARPKETKLYKQLIESLVEILPNSETSLTDIYDLVKKHYPELCDDTYLCKDNCSSVRSSNPEWKHVVRKALDYLKRKGFLGSAGYGIWKKLNH